MQAPGQASHRRALAACTGICLLAGIALVVVGAAARHIPATAGGGGIVLATTVAASMLVIHRWLTDVTAERARLAQATRDADTERTRYIAANAALQQEQQRVRTDLQDHYRRTQLELARHRAALDDEFETRRAELAAKAFELGATMALTGKLTADPGTSADVVHLPTRQPQRQRAATRQ
jgi:hypothetical protein